MRYGVMFASVILLASTSIAHPQEKEKKARIAELKKEIESLKASLTKLEKELTKLSGSLEIGPVKKAAGRTVYSLKVGDEGKISDQIYTVSQVIGKEQAIVRIDGFSFAALKTSTEGLAPGISIQIKGIWRVVSPVGYRGSTYPAIEAVDVDAELYVP